MRRLLNTLFVTSEDAYLTLDGENIVVRREKEETARVSSAQSGRDRQLLLCRGFARSDGGLYQTQYRPELLHAERQISGADGGRGNRECAAAQRAVPDSG